MSKLVANCARVVDRLRRPFTGASRGRKDRSRDACRQANRILELAVEGIVLMDAEGTVIRVNARAEEMFGWKRSHAIGQPFTSLVFPGVGRALFEAYLGVLRETGRHPWDGKCIEVPIREKLITDVSIAQYSAGGETVVAAFFRDVTDRKNFEGVSGSVEGVRATEFHVTPPFLGRR